jgi:hypothetical protein
VLALALVAMSFWLDSRSVGGALCTLPWAG